MTVEEIVHGCKSVDRKAQDAMVKLYAGKLMALCMRYTKDQDLAKDALQETFISAFKYINSYSGTGSFEGWLRRIAVNQSLKLLKDLKQHLHSNESYIDTNAFAEVPDVYSTLGKEEILKLLKHLPQSQFVVFNLCVVEGYNHTEVADMLNITESTSRATLCKARNRLVEIMQNQHKNYLSTLGHVAL